MIIKALEIKQNKEVFYLASVSSCFLARTCSTNMKDIIKSKDIYQRRLNEGRVIQISQYAKRTRALFPTCVVLNSHAKLKYNPQTMELEVPEEENSFFIIDGQHRIAGINKSEKDYQLGVVIMDCVPIELQSELFITINSEQKTVHPNIRFNMRSNDRYYTPEKMALYMAEMLNGDDDSPFYNKIWMDDSTRRRGELPLSLSAFCDPLCAYIYNSRDYYAIKDVLNDNSGNMDSLRIFSGKYKNNILWPIYINKREDVLYRILFNYFRAVRDVYEKEWNDPRSILLKTTGYNALMILFKGMFLYCRNNDNTYTHKRMMNVLYNNKIDSENFYSSNIGVGRSAAYDLYNRLKPDEFEDEGINADFLNSMSDDPDQIMFD